MVTKRDLFEVPNTPLPDGAILTHQQPVLHCDVCGENFSATPGDYWQLADDEPLTCCDEPMRLGFWRRWFEEVEQ